MGVEDGWGAGHISPGMGRCLGGVLDGEGVGVFCPAASAEWVWVQARPAASVKAPPVKSRSVKKRRRETGFMA